MSHDGVFRNSHSVPGAGLGFENEEKVAVTGFDYREQDREFIEELHREWDNGVKLDKFQIMREVFDLVFRDTNVKLLADCYYYVTGISGLSEVELAEKYDVTKAAVSKRVKQLQPLIGWGLPPAAAMRKDEACRTFEKATKKVWKRIKSNQPKPLFLNPIQAKAQSAA